MRKSGLLKVICFVAFALAASTAGASRWVVLICRPPIHSSILERIGAPPAARAFLSQDWSIPLSWSAQEYFSVEDDTTYSLISPPRLNWLRTRRGWTRSDLDRYDDRSLGNLLAPALFSEADDHDYMLFVNSSANDRHLQPLVSRMTQRGGMTGALAGFNAQRMLARTWQVDFSPVTIIPPSGVDRGPDVPTRYRQLQRETLARALGGALDGSGEIVLIIGRYLTSQDWDDGSFLGVGADFLSRILQNRSA